MTRPAVTPDPGDTGTDHHHDDHEDEGYRGPATLDVDGTEYAVEVQLLGHFQPLDGWYHWYGRVSAHAGLDAALGGKKAAARITTPQGAADGELSDVDPWGRYRVAGTSTPPFSVGAPTDADAHTPAGAA